MGGLNGYGRKKILDSVLCPLIEDIIEPIECIVTRDVVNQILVESVVPDKNKTKNEWRTICINCKYHNYYWQCFVEEANTDE